MRLERWLDTHVTNRVLFPALSLGARLSGLTRLIMVAIRVITMAIWVITMPRNAHLLRGPRLAARS